jgi:Copine
VNDLLTQKEFIVTKKKGKDDGSDIKKKEVGKIIVISANVSDGTSNGSRSIESSPSRNDDDDDDEEEEDIVVEATDGVELASEEFLLEGGPTFADYVSGGCQLRATVAIDFTASNGNPREESSLHYFSLKKQGSSENMNDYEKAITSICTVLADFDTDQKFPVLGFGAKLKNGGPVSHCFPCGGGSGGEVEGLMGIIDAYHQTIKGGIAMSKPTDITHVIRAAGKDARDYLVRRGNIVAGPTLLSCVCVCVCILSAYFILKC